MIGVGISPTRKPRPVATLSVDPDAAKKIKNFAAVNQGATDRLTWTNPVQSEDFSSIAVRRAGSVVDRLTSITFGAETGYNVPVIDGRTQVTYRLETVYNGVVYQTESITLTT